MAFIAVIGGGIAGLASAWRLQRAGHEVCVLEREAEPGGRIRAHTRGRFRVETGAPGFARADTAIRQVIEAVGLAGTLRPWARGVDLWLDVDGFHDPKGPRGRGALRDVVRALRLAVAHRPSRAQAAAAVRAPRGLATQGLSWLPAVPGATGADRRALALLRRRWRGAELVSLAGGSEALVSALAAPVRLARGFEVLSVETDTGGAHLRVREPGAVAARSLEADAVVVAVPGSRVSTLCPKLTPLERGTFEALRYAPMILVSLAYERSPALRGARSIGFARGAGFELSGVVCEHLRSGAAPLGSGLLRVLLASEAGARMHRASDASVADLVVENLAAPPLRLPLPDDYAVFRFVDGVPRFDAATLARLARFHGRSERSPRLAFAGDALAGPSVEAALESGLDAASQILVDLAGGR